jgi:hypothetical protein
MNWKVERHGGASMHKWRQIFTGTEENARYHHAKVSESLRQGAVRLLDPAGNIIKQSGSPRLRTRW